MSESSRKMITRVDNAMTAAGEPPFSDESPQSQSSDDCLRDTVTGDEKLPPPTTVTDWTYKNEESDDTVSATVYNL